nr:hypothetical protein [Candidatus Sigynarchaeum springense]
MTETRQQDNAGVDKAGAREREIDVPNPSTSPGNQGIPQPGNPRQTGHEEINTAAGAVISIVHQAAHEDASAEGIEMSADLGNTKAAHEWPRDTSIAPSEDAGEKKPPKIGELKCKSCVHCLDECVPAVIF